MQTIQHSTPKASRAEAFSIVSELLAGEDVDKYLLESLYKYFMPALPKVAKNTFQWVAKACADKKDAREPLQYVYIADGTMYGTDGHRLHWAPTSLEDGYYCPKSGNRLEDSPGNFPDCQRIITDKPDRVDLPIDELEIKVDLARKESTVDIGPVRLNYKYLMDALNWHEYVTLYCDGPNNSVRGPSRFGEFIIMPMRK